MTYKKYNKGFTLVETIVAITVIIIVSFAALSVVMSTTSIMQKSTVKSLAVNECTNVINCFNSGSAQNALRFYTADENLAITNNSLTISYDEKFNIVNSDNASVVYRLVITLTGVRTVDLAFFRAKDLADATEGSTATALYSIVAYISGSMGTGNVGG